MPLSSEEHMRNEIARLTGMIEVESVSERFALIMAI